MADKPGAPNQTLCLTRLFHVPRKRLFAAWTDPQTLMDWFSPSNDYSTPQAEVDLRVGGRYRIEMKGADASLYTVMGLYREVRPAERLVFTWTWAGKGYGGQGLTEFYDTLVTLDFRTVPGGTELTLIHERFPTTEERDRHRSGWTGCLDHLSAILERASRKSH
jgi:uncharacterized protein YndB with AHSA1/START domain